MKFRHAIINFLAILGAVAAYGFVCLFSTMFGPLLLPNQDLGQSGLGAFSIGFVISTIVVISFGLIAILMHFLLSRITKYE